MSFAESTSTTPTEETPGAPRRTAAATVALVGNPNTGKTSLFNALTGFRRHVANYPGVTVDIARGPIRNTQQPLTLIDLPGTYSLAAVSPDEAVVADMLCCRLDPLRCPDVIVACADAANLRRNMYFISQLLELGRPVVVALNMMDVARARGLEINTELLSERLGVPVIPVIATRPRTITPLIAAIENALDADPPARRADLPPELVHEAARLDAKSGGVSLPEALRVLLDKEGHAETQFLAGGGARELVEDGRRRLAEQGIDGPAVEVRARYNWINQVLDGAVRRPESEVVTWSDRLDRILTHRLAGAAVLLAVLFVVFQAIFSWATPLMDIIEGVFGALGGVVATWLPEGAIRSLLVDGIIGGVGGVLVFLPQIIILFAVIAVLEDCGYMARAAFMMDRLMRSIGLSGRAFIPLLSAFACAIPAIMGTRTIADRRERFVTILVAPFMSCSARLPVYVLLTAAFIPPLTYLGGWIGLQGLVMMGMYFVGVAIAIPVAWLLRKTAFAGPPPAFLLELPSYKVPRLKAIWQRVWFASKSFIVRAGTIILLVNLVVWLLGYFPRSAETQVQVAEQAEQAGWGEERYESELAGAYLRNSYLGTMGRAIEPVIEPIGWDWRVGVAVVASFPAREVVIGTLGTICNLGEEQDEGSLSLRESLRNLRWDGTDQPVFTLPVALSLMVFFALCAQCSSTLVIIGREMGSWIWPAISFAGMTLIAYGAALCTAQLARFAGL